MLRVKELKTIHDWNILTTYNKRVANNLGLAKDSVMKDVLRKFKNGDRTNRIFFLFKNGVIIGGSYLESADYYYSFNKKDDIINKPFDRKKVVKPCYWLNIYTIRAERGNGHSRHLIKNIKRRIKKPIAAHYIYVNSRCPIAFKIFTEFKLHST